MRAVGLGGTVVRTTAADAANSLSGEFDIIFVDPPYADDDRSVASLLESLTRLTAAGGVVVVHRQARSTLEVPDFLTCTDERRYGDAVVTMMERIEA
ncbi:MAG: hypothetical protein DWP92_02860 [Armatimonadetes bacterium]|nr:MAG: hypothetical protein DWP92_02860 [Armatimonadota bacterium]